MAGNVLLLKQLPRAVKRILLAVLVVSTAANVFARPAVSQQPEPCTRRTVLVTVVDQGGEPISGLTARNFRGEFRGKPVKILSVREQTLQPRVLVLLDATESMRGVEDSKWRLVTTLAAHVAQSLPKEAPMGVLMYNNAVAREISFGISRETLLETLRQWQEKEAIPSTLRGTATPYPFILEALKKLAPSKPGDLIYLLSDGGGNLDVSRRIEFEEEVVAQKAELESLHSGVRVFGTLLAPRNPSDRLPVQGIISQALSVAELAHQSGGHAVIVRGLGYYPSEDHRLDSKRAAELTAELNRLYRQMSEVYAIEMELASPADKPREWDLKLDMGSKRTPKDMEILYPAKLMPCTAPTK